MAIYCGAKRERKPFNKTRRLSATGIVFTIILLCCRETSAFSSSLRPRRSLPGARERSHLYAPSSWGSPGSKFVVSMQGVSSGEQESSSSVTMTDNTTTDLISKLAMNIVYWIGSTTSIVVAGTFFAVLAWKRNALMVSFFFGSIANAILSKVLKRALNQERPLNDDTTDTETQSQQVKIKPSDKGMPSSHAMSLGFIGTFTALVLPWTRLGLLAYVTCSLIYRIQSNLHSWQQVAVGVVMGSLNGCIWKLVLCDGNNFVQFNLLDWTTSHFLNSQGVLPLPFMLVPITVGVLVVGSFERRISQWIKDRKETEDSSAKKGS